MVRLRLISVVRRLVMIQSPSDFAALADQYLGVSGGTNLVTAGRYCSQLAQAVGDNSIANALIANVFWQSFTSSTAFDREAAQAGVSPIDYTQSEIFVLGHGTEWLRQDLLIFAPQFSNTQPSVVSRVSVSDHELTVGWERFVSSPDIVFDGGHGPLIAQAGYNIAIEANKAQPFGLMVLPTPQVQPTASLPSPAMGVTDPATSMMVSTVGVAAQDTGHRVGVTTSFHLIEPLIKAVPVKVIVDSLMGTIDPADTNKTHDSCFIELPGISSVATIPLSGPLYGTIPPAGAAAWFQRPGVGRIPTTVHGSNWNLPHRTTPPQTLLTSPVTLPGDSGTALIYKDPNGVYVIGFASDLITSCGAGGSRWIWAKAVFKVHSLH